MNSANRTSSVIVERVKLAIMASRSQMHVSILSSEAMAGAVCHGALDIAKCTAIAMIR